MVSYPPARVMARLKDLMVEDGFRRSTSGLYFKPWRGEWTGWISVPGTAYDLEPGVGVYNKRVLRIGRRAFASIGYPSKHKFAGPPLIIAGLERLMGIPLSEINRQPWHIDPREHREMQPSVVDALVENVRRFGYPFIEEHLSFESVLEAARGGMAGPSFTDYLPVILLMTGRQDDIPIFRQEWKMMTHDKELLEMRERYVNALLDLFRQGEIA
jgi:hypothetical protein